MAKAPKCKLCGHEHWLSEPHIVVPSGRTNVSRETMQQERYRPLLAGVFDWAQRERELGLRDA